MSKEKYFQSDFGEKTVINWTSKVENFKTPLTELRVQKLLRINSPNDQYFLGNLKRIVEKKH